MTDEWKDITTGFMTLDELIMAHGTTANLMHANNPYRDELAIDEFEKQFSIWRDKLVRLLNHHLVKFQDKNTIICWNAGFIDGASSHCLVRAPQ
jgi:hypothetical protein